jgi:hypothetical protein
MTGNRLPLMRNRIHHHRTTLIAACATVLLLSPRTAAMGQLVGQVSADVENDYFDFWLPPQLRSDDNYTHGAHLGATVGSLPRWMRRSLPGCSAIGVNAASTAECVQGAVGVGQELYTPSNDTSFPVDGERPYAALLFLDLTMQQVGPSSVGALTLRTGTTGHAARGDALQTWFHHLVPGFRTPLGWSHQIASKPVAQLSYEYRRYLSPVNAPRSWGFAFIPSASLSAGTLGAAASARADLRAGFRVPHPWRRDAVAQSGIRAYLLVGAEEQAMAHSVILEGNTAETRGRVEPTTLIPQWYAGVGLGVWRLAMEYRAQTRGREYESGPAHHSWGTIGVSLVLY